VKLSPLVTDIGLIARAAEEAGADALTVAKPYPAMAIDFPHREVTFGNKTGGLSGPPLNHYFEAGLGNAEDRQDTYPWTWSIETLKTCLIT